MRELIGRTALVSGAESGIGAACALAFGEAGATVALLYYRDAAAAEVTRAEVASLGVEAVATSVDVTDEQSVDAAFDTVTGLVGVPDILINSAGLNQSGVALADMSLDQWNRLIATDLTGAFLMCRRFVRDLRKAGRSGDIVNITSIHAGVARPGAADYDSAKGGLRSLTETLALETASLGISVNAIAPGMILTPMNGRAMADDAYRRTLEASIPWGRAGRPEEVAKLAVYLASPAGDYITGASFVIDGGLSLVLGRGA